MASCGNNANYEPAVGGDNCEDCVRIVKTSKKVQVPCTRTRQVPYNIKVPRQIMKKVPRTVHYTEKEGRSRQVPYQTTRQETRMRTEQQAYKEPVTKKVTKMISVVKKVPKTIYVDVTVQEPREETVVVYEDRQRHVKIPYTVNIPETKYRTENYQIDVPRQKTVFDDVTETVYDTQVRTRCEKYTKMITKEVPVYNVIARNPPPCPPQASECAPCQQSYLSAPAPVDAGMGMGAGMGGGMGSGMGMGYADVGGGYGMEAAHGSPAVSASHGSAEAVAADRAAAPEPAQRSTFSQWVGTMFGQNDQKTQG